MLVFAEGKGDTRGGGDTRGREWTRVAIHRSEGWEAGFVVVLFILLSLPLVSLVSWAS